MLDMKKNMKDVNLNKLNKINSEIKNILESLIEFLCIHIDNQINSGADVIQIFDSWAGLIPADSIRDYCYTPNSKIIDFCKKKNIPNICFPKGIKEKYEEFNKLVKPDCINLDAEIDPIWAKNKLKNTVLQGGLDPKLLLQSEEKLFEGATKYIKAFKDLPYIFNLGHGLLPQTDPDKVDKLVKFYRNF